MLVANRLFLFLAIGLSVMVDATKAQTVSGNITYRSLYRSGLITVNSFITTDDSSSWVSNSGRFAFGFYRQDNCFSVGIRLFASPSQTVVVWVARPEPIMCFSKDAFLNFTRSGIFVTQGSAAFVLANFSLAASSAAMLDNGDLVAYSSITNSSNTLAERYNDSRCNSVYSRCRVFPSNSSFASRSDSSNTLWSSFDFPSDTILVDQSLPCGYNLTSATGKNALNLQCNGASLLFYQPNSAVKKWDTGASGRYYNTLNLDFLGRLYLRTSSGYEKSLSSYYSAASSNMLYRATLDPDGIFRLYAHSLDDNSTRIINEIPYYRDLCQAKIICGVNSYCLIINSNPVCHCIPGFNYINWRSPVAGCQRLKSFPICNKLGSAAAINLSMEVVENIVGMDELAYGLVFPVSREECSSTCLDDCNCEAASFIDQKCLKLKLPLTSGRRDSNYPSITFIKLANTGGGPLPTSGQKRREIRIAAIFISVAAAIGIWMVVGSGFIGAYWLMSARYREKWRRWEMALSEEIAPQYFSYQELLNGTNEFKHRLGKGGHGTVFKADLQIGGNDIAVAVKRLHGAEIEEEREFHAEMRLIGRAYHVNVIRLLGFCHNGPDQHLVYEYMPRGSLANHIFECRGQRPSWKRRMEILLGAARGIHYLHHDCETKIIHRDIKPENILIAEDWTAKISDFGLAKLLSGNQTRAATRTLAAGTEGYIAPECERDASGTGEAHVTEKVDVYSYGMVVLETVCSKRNREEKLLLRGLVCKSYEADELSRLVDGEDVEACDLEKMVKVGLLCVQEDPIMRPCMEDVVMMIEGDIDVPNPLSMLSSF